MSVNDTTGGEVSETEKSRRDFMKTTGAVAAAGALGGLASTDVARGLDEGGSQEEVTVTFLSANGVENSAIQNHYQEAMGIFEDKNEGVTVDLQTASYGDILEQLSSTVEGGNPPALAESGSLGLEFFNGGQVIDHGPYIEETEGYPDDWTEANQQSADFRGDWWSGGSPRHTTSNLGIRPSVFSQVGIEDPEEDLATWSQFHEAISRIDEEMDIIAYEETGVNNDLESYWGQARTAYTDGTDPWIRGEGTDPEVVIGNEDHEDRPNTDGMIKNCITLAQEFSSAESASRTDEEIPSLMLTDRVASFTYATPTATRWQQVKEDVQIGWHDGEGDFMLLPNPRLDPDYGSEVGISELEGLEGEHGGHVWALEQQHTVFEGVDERQQEAAWDLNVFLQGDEEFVLPAWGEHYESIPGRESMMDPLLDEYGDQMEQNFQRAIELMDEYGSQYSNTGGPWDVMGTDQIRWTDINETISQAIAGQHEIDETPSIVRDRVLTTLEERN